MSLTSQEKLLLNTQILQFASMNFNTIIQDFQTIAHKDDSIQQGLDEMIELHNEINRDLVVVRDKLLNFLDGRDAIGESDMEIINPLLEALNKAE